MADMTFQAVNSDFDKVDEIEKIYEEAFPAEERKLTIDDFLVLIGKDQHNRLLAINQGDELMGFVAVIEMEEYIYGLYLAIRSDRRGNGYGSKVMQALLEWYSDKTFLFAIEKPEENAPNNAQRLKREALYKRFGCVRAGYDTTVGGVDYTFMCSRLSDKVTGYIEDLLKRIKEM